MLKRSNISRIWLLTLICIGMILPAGLQAQHDVCKYLNEIISTVDITDSFQSIRQDLKEENLRKSSFSENPDTIRQYACSVGLHESIPGTIEYSSFMGGSWKYYLEYSRTTDLTSGKMDYWLWRNQIRKCLEEKGEWVFEEITEKQGEWDEVLMRFIADKEMDDTMGLRHIIVEVELRKGSFSDEYVVRVLVH